MSAWKSATITPSAARLTESLRDIGYDFPSAVADIVDNSVMAGASHVDVTIEFAGGDSYVVISDDGDGMTGNGLIEALRYGSRRSYGRSDLGRYGLGLKTASMSQCRSVTVLSCRHAAPEHVSTGTLDLDLINEWDEWLIFEPPPAPVIEKSKDRLVSERVQVGRCDLRVRRLSAEVAKPLEHGEAVRERPLHLPVRLLDVFPVSVRIRALRDLQVERQRVEDVLQVVRNPRRHLTQGPELLGAREHLARLAKLFVRSRELLHARRRREKSRERARKPRQEQPCAGAQRDHDRVGRAARQRLRAADAGRTGLARAGTRFVAERNRKA